MGKTNSKDNITLDKADLLDLLKHKSQQGHDILSHYIRAFAIYVAILGGLLKFAYDQNATEQLRKILLSAGIALTIIGAFTCLLGEMLRRTIMKDIHNFNKKLGAPLLPNQMDHIKYTVILSFSFVILSFFALGYLMFIQVTSEFRL